MFFQEQLQGFDIRASLFKKTFFWFKSYYLTFLHELPIPLISPFLSNHLFAFYISAIHQFARCSCHPVELIVVLELRSPLLDARFSAIFAPLENIVAQVLVM
ncbi:hypothetical protein ES703_74700 [subsurface metagenome]